MSFYYPYIVNLAQRLQSDPQKTIKILDYGCGSGAIVKLALDRKLDAYGVDLFYGGGSKRAAAQQIGLWNTRIFELPAGNRIPMDDATFDVVLSNQVFEHIDDFSVPLREIDRVLRPGGTFINIFPSDRIWREGHIGIPFSHWMRRGSRLRYGYTLTLRSLGAGYAKGNLTSTQWTERRLDWIDRWTHYKPLPEIERAFVQYFSIEYYEADYMKYRIERHPLLRHMGWLVRRDLMRPLLAFVGSRLACHVFVLRKREAAG